MNFPLWNGLKKLIAEMVNESVPKRFKKAEKARGGISTRKHSVKLIAHRMELHKEFGKTWAKKILKDPKYRNGVSERDLQNDLPDYIPGRDISDLFK